MREGIAAIVLSGTTARSISPFLPSLSFAFEGDEHRARSARIPWPDRVGDYFLASISDVQ